MVDTLLSAELLSINVRIAMMQLIDVLLRNRQRIANLHGCPDNRGVIFGHDSSFNGGLGVWPHRKNAVILQQYGIIRAGALIKCANDFAANFLTADQRETRAGNWPAEFVSHCG